jgi:hypothetical protein
MNTSRRSDAAYHEAGHAVVALTLGYQVELVTIVPTAGSDGHVRWNNPTRRRSVREALEFGLQVERRRHLVEHEIIVNLAGSLAQRRHRPHSPWRRDAAGAKRGQFVAKGSDYQHALELVAWLHEGQQQVINTYSRYLEARAEALVNARWENIERLAVALLESETLKGDEVRMATLSPEARALAVDSG